MELLSKNHHQKNGKKLVSIKNRNLFGKRSFFYIFQIIWIQTITNIDIWKWRQMLFRIFRFGLTEFQKKSGAYIKL